MDTVRRVIGTLVRETDATDLLRHRPEEIVRRLGLGPNTVEAFRTADRFFPIEKPILDQPRTLTTGVQAVPTASQTFRAIVLPTPVSVSADTGTLLPGPTTGTYTISSSATATATLAPTVPRPPVTPRPPTPAPRVPVPQAPSPQPTPQPGAVPPSLPGVVPFPRTPSLLWSPSSRAQPTPGKPAAAARSSRWSLQQRVPRILRSRPSWR
jgi:hypothetical protein